MDMLARARAVTDELFAMVRPDSLYERLRRDYLPAGWEKSLEPRGLGWHWAASGRRFLRSPQKWLQTLGAPSYQAAS